MENMTSIKMPSLAPGWELDANWQKLCASLSDLRNSMGIGDGSQVSIQLLRYTFPQCMQIWLLMTELWRVFNIVNSELLLPVEIKMLPNNLFHKIFIRGMFTVHPIIPSVRVGVLLPLLLLTDPFVASSSTSSTASLHPRYRCAAPPFMRK